MPCTTTCTCTSKGVSIKPNELARPIAGKDDFNPVIGVDKVKGNCIEGSSTPYTHSDLSNGMCYHYVITGVTEDGESPCSEEVMSIPSPYLCVMQFGEKGVDDGEFRSPTGIAIDSEGCIYAADTDNRTVQKFYKKGTFISRWGGDPDSEEWSFCYPRGLATTLDGYVYVVDSGIHRIIKFVPTEEELARGRELAEKSQESTDGIPIPYVVAKPGDTEAILSWLEVPGAISYNLYFSTDPGLTKETGTKVEGVTSPHSHIGLTNNTPYSYVLTCVDESENEGAISEEQAVAPVLIDLAAPQNPDLVMNHGAYMTSSLDVVATISAKDMDTGVAGYFISENPMTPSATLPGWIEVEPEYQFGASIPFSLSPGDGPKTVYVWFKDVGNNTSVPASANILLNASGYVCTGTWGKPGRGASMLHGGEFMGPLYGMTMDRQGAIFVVDNGNNRVQKFENSGNFIMLWGNFAPANGNFTNPTGVAYDGKGDVYVCDTNNHRIQKFDGKLGHFLRKFGGRRQRRRPIQCSMRSRC